MALNKVAIVRGEWQLDKDQVVRLYVRPSIILIDPGGTHHVSSFAEPTGRGTCPPDTTPCAFFQSTSGAGPTSGLRYWQDQIPEDGFRLEPAPGLTATVFGIYDENCSPFAAFLIAKSEIVWDVTKMDPHVLSVDEIISLNQYDQHFIQPLKRLRCNEPRNVVVSDSGEGRDPSTGNGETGNCNPGTPSC